MQRELTIREAIAEALSEEMERDENVILIGEDIDIANGFGGPFGVTMGFAEKFGEERVLNTPISEALIAGCATGAAISGLRPVAEVQYADFLFCAADQIINQMAKLRYMSGGQVALPLVMRAPVGATGRGAQHAQSPEAFFINVPGLKIVAPSSSYDAKGLLKAAIRDNDPVLFFEHKLLYGTKGVREEKGAWRTTSYVPQEEYLIPLGKAEIKREGKDITVVATLLMVHKALVAAQKLSEEGISLEVIDPRSLVPLDKETIINSVKKTGRLAIVEESPQRGGIGAEIAAIVAEEASDYLDAPIKRIASFNVPIPAAPVLENFVVPGVERIKKDIRKMIRG